MEMEMEIGERAWLMREALERARHDLAYRGSLAHIDPSSRTSDPHRSRLDAPLGQQGPRRLDSLTIDPAAEPPM